MKKTKKKTKAKLVEVDTPPSTNGLTPRLIPSYAIIPGEKAKEYAAEFQVIKDKHGILNSKTIVGEAKQPSSPLHDWSGWKGWNKDAAAESYWLSAASKLVSVVTFRLINDPRKDRASFRAVVSYVRDDGKKDYDGVLNLLQVEAYKEQLIRKEMNIIRGAKMRLRDYSEFIAFTSALDDVLASGDQLLEKLVASKKAK